MDDTEYVKLVCHENSSENCTDVWTGGDVEEWDTDEEGSWYATRPGAWNAAAGEFQSIQKGPFLL